MAISATKRLNLQIDGNLAPNLIASLNLLHSKLVGIQKTAQGINLPGTPGGGGGGGGGGGSTPAASGNPYVDAAMVAIKQVQGTFRAIEGVFGRLVFLMFIMRRITYEVWRFWQGVFQKVAEGVKKIVDLSKQLITTTAELENYYSRLSAVFAGTSGKVLQEIVKFARKVPYDIEQIMAAYIKMHSLGIDQIMSRERAVRAAGNLAQIFGRSLEDAMMAIGMAGAGRMDRLIRGFGIRATDLQKYGAKLGGRSQLLSANPEQRAANMMSVVRLIEDRWDSALESMEQNFTQLLSNMRDLFYSFALQLDQVGFVRLFSSVLASVQELYDRLEQAGVIKQWIGYISGAAVIVRNFFLNILGWAPDVVTEILKTFYSLIKLISDFITSMGGAERIAKTFAGGLKFIVTIGEQLTRPNGFFASLINNILPSAIRLFGEVTHAITGLLDALLGLVEFGLKMSPEKLGALVGGIAMLRAIISGDPSNPVAYIGGIAAAGAVGGAAGSMVGRELKKSGLSASDIHSVRQGLRQSGDAARFGTAGIADVMQNWKGVSLNQYDMRTWADEWYMRGRPGTRGGMAGGGMAGELSGGLYGRTTPVGQYMGVGGALGTDVPVTFRDEIEAGADYTREQIETGFQNGANTLNSVLNPPAAEGGIKGFGGASGTAFGPWKGMGSVGTLKGSVYNPYRNVNWDTISRGALDQAVLQLSSPPEQRDPPMTAAYKDVVKFGRRMATDYAKRRIVGPAGAMAWDAINYVNNYFVNDPVLSSEQLAGAASRVANTAARNGR